MVSPPEGTELGIRFGIVAVLAYLIAALAQDAGFAADVELAVEFLLLLAAPALLAGIGAFRAGASGDRPVVAVVAAFALAGLLYGLGITAVHWVLLWEGRGLAAYLDVLRLHGGLVGVFALVGALGALGGDLLAPRLRAARR